MKKRKQYTAKQKAQIVVELLKEEKTVIKEILNEEFGLFKKDSLTRMAN